MADDAREGGFLSAHAFDCGAKTETLEKNRDYARLTWRIVNVDNCKHYAYNATMNAKSLRELQQKGGKAIGTEPLVVISRKGPVGVLIPVTSESLPRVQQEVQRMLALESLAETWKLAHETGLDGVTSKEIEAEIRAVRKSAHAQPKRRR